MANKNILKNNDNRLVYLEPNCSNREIPDNEDFSILVNLKSILKNRTTLIDGQISSTVGGGIDVGFIDGTNIGGGRRSLTTNYTEISTDFTQGGEDDLETLGIESIDITFDTAYTPMIKIKFIDIRGNAVLTKGQDSKYKMFFDLPFPIFELTVKGFYGKAVTYCLHLTKWNSSFNSSTGNFEIDTEFIGYTYALLTDCLLGYMRATSLTKIGGPIFNKYKTMLNKDNTKKYPNLIPIDEFLDYVNKINDEFTGVKHNSEDVKQLNSLTNLREDINDIENYINDFKKQRLSANGINIFSGQDINLVLLSKTNYSGTKKTGVDNLIRKYKSTIERLAKEINKPIEITNLKLNLGAISYVGRIFVNINSNQYGETVTSVTTRAAAGLTSEKIEKIKEMIEESPAAGFSGFYFLFDFSGTADEIFRVRDEIRKRNEILNDNLTAIVKSKVDQLSFKPTIRNIVNMLSVHAQVFLETLSEVSKKAEKNSGRKKAILKIQEFSKKNNSDKEIYPWPEYRKKGVNGSLVETWIGSGLNNRNDYEKVNEVMFVEELLTNLIKIARKDEIREITGSANTPDFFPVSPAEIKILDDNGKSLINKNPYYQALKSSRSLGSPQEAIRCLLYRLFLSQGVANSTGGEEQLQIVGELEAENLHKVLLKEFDKILRDNIISSINMIGPAASASVSSASEWSEEVMEIWSKGNAISGVIHPPNADGKLMKKYSSLSVDYYYYEYILNDYNQSYNGAPQNISYIPISGNFDGQDFYEKTSSGDFKFKSLPQLTTLSKELLFTSDYFTTRGSILNPKYNEDGAFYLKILVNENGDNLRVTKPEASSIKLEEYKKRVKEDSIILTEDNSPYFKAATYGKNTYKDYSGELVKNDLLNRYNGSLNVLEINSIKDFKDNSIIKPVTEFYFTNSKQTTNVGFFLALNNPSDISDAMTTHNIHYKGLEKINGKKVVRVFSEVDNFKKLSGNKNSDYKKNITKINKAGCGVSMNQKDCNRPLDFGNQKKITSLLINEESSSVDTYVPFIDFTVKSNFTKNRHSLSLFGSLFYYNQDKDNIDGDVGKAFLFLNAISWEGVVGDVLNTNRGIKITNSSATSVDNPKRQAPDGYEAPNVSLFDTVQGDRLDTAPNDTGKYETFKSKDDTYILKGLYSNDGSIIKAPKLWCAFIGSLLYRYDYAQDTSPVKKESGKNLKKDIIQFFIDDNSNPPYNYVFPGQDKDTYFPDHTMYLYASSNDTRSGINIDTTNMFNNVNNDTTKTGVYETSVYGKVDSTILNLPAQARQEFIRIFKTFVKTDFLEIQKEYELFTSVLDLKVKYNKVAKKVQHSEASRGRLTYFYKIPTKFKTANDYINWGLAERGTKSNQDYPTFRYVSAYPTDKSHGQANNYDFFPKFLDKFIYVDDIDDILGTKVNNYTNISPINNNYFQKANRFKTDVNRTEVWITDASYLLFLPINPDETNQVYQFDLTLRNNSTNQSILTSLFSRTYEIANATPRIFNQKANVIPESAYIARNQPRIRIRDLDKMLKFFITRFRELTKDPDRDDDRIQQKIFNSVDDDIIKLNIYRTLASINDKWLGGETKHLPCTNIEKIAESFRFLDSGFLDIGDDFFINPLSVQQKMIGNYNQTFFDLVNSILIENNFNFIALPTYIDFTTAKHLKEDVFTPYSWSERISKDTSGAQFICVYVGQQSSNLNLGDEANHEDDGFNVISDGNCDDTTGTSKGPLPEVFQNSKAQKGYSIPYFLVSYGKGNQSIFKDIKLDQREFTETAESLEIINDLSDSGDTSKTSYKGQNLFNIYQKRAYSAEVEMMGCATIQPMMYFQLNNIPMFKGAYLIYKTTHSITVHNMKTTFKGSRIKKVKTPLITEVQLFRSLIGNLKEVGEAKKISNENLNIRGNDVFIDTPLSTNILPVDPSRPTETISVKPIGLIKQPPSPGNAIYPYGIREVVETVQRIAKEFYEYTDNLTGTGTARNIYWNDLSVYGGGTTPGHKSHKKGIDIDIRPILNIKGARSIDITMLQANTPFYDQTLTKELINRLLKIKYLDSYGIETTQLALDKIYFNDSDFNIEFPGKVNYSDGHGNHLHIRFNVPERVKKERESTPIENSRTFTA